MSLDKLRTRWLKDKNFFLHKEIGELQDFVKDVLQEDSLFNLNKGLGSKSNNERTNEFTTETSKDKRRADFVIFINGDDVVIPVEVERHQNIKKGIEQVFQYQKDWKKKFSILTDGNEWRLYRSNKFRAFYIEDMLNDPKDFLIYWKEFIKPENYYIELFNTDSPETLEKLNLNERENRILFFDDITRLINNFKGKMKAIGAFGNIFKQNEYEKVAVETSYAYLIQFILYKVLVDNEYQKFKTNYDLIFKKIQKALQDQDFYSIIINEVKNISEYISEHIYKPFHEKQKGINKKLIENLKGDLSIDEISPWLDIILFINRYDFSGIKNEIFGYVYENYLKDLYEEQNKGQYFTDPSVVNFMLEEIGFTEQVLKDVWEKKEMSLIDPSCGAGTFLYSAVDKIINAFDDGSRKRSDLIMDLIDKNIFGLDIEEFPLYLAEMNVLMRMLPLIVNDSYENPVEGKLKIFKTKDSIGEFLETGINHKTNQEIDFGKTALDYPSFMRDEKDLEEMLISLKERAGVRERFDFVIGNPPYVGYNECCKQGIVFIKRIQDKLDFSIDMSNVYGMNLNTVQGRKKPYSPKPNLFAFFIALGVGLLKEGGKICYIIPQTILTSGDLDVVRYHLSKFVSIEKIITFDGKMFVGRGLKQDKPVSTSSLILLLKKQKPTDSHEVEIVTYENYNNREGIDFDKYIKDNNRRIKKVMQTDLFKNIANWNFLKYGTNHKVFLELYRKNSYSIEEYRKFCLKEYDEVQFDKGLVFKKDKISKHGDWALIRADSKSYKPSIRDEFISKEFVNLPQGAQGFNLFENKFKLVWRYMNFDKFYFVDEKIMIDFNWVVISSNNKDEILMLFAILNSFLTTIVINSLFKSSNEQALLLGIRSVKEFIRIPKINNKNESIKKEIIRQTERLLLFEDCTLKDFVGFSVSMQKFSKVIVESEDVSLIDKNGVSTKQKIKTKKELVRYLIEEFNKESRSEIDINDLKHLKAVDRREQSILKDYIDDLVFALYFDIDIKSIGLSNAINIKRECMKNEYYKHLLDMASL